MKRKAERMRDSWGMKDARKKRIAEGTKAVDMRMKGNAERTRESWG